MMKFYCFIFIFINCHNIISKLIHFACKTSTKSSNSNKRSSLKQQLRGHERLLAKISNGSNADDEKTKELRSKITVLKKEISQKQHKA